QVKVVMLPQWLTVEYIQKALQSYSSDTKLKVLKLWAKPATAKGENFIAAMTRIYVDFEKSDGSVHKKSYILKQNLTGIPETKIFEEYDVYNREMDMYDIVLPKLTKILSEVGITDKIAADAIIVDRERTAMILEDLAPLQYKNADRLQQLDMVHAKLTLDMLAKFHAAATVLHEREPKILSTNYYSHFFSRGKKGFREVFSGLFRAFIRYIRTQPELNKNYGAKLEKTLENLMEYAARALDVGDSDLKTLVHGDCWTTNIMFQYGAEGNPLSVIPIDFQFSTLTSPVVDLHYFFNTSLREEVKEKEPELVQYHYYALKRTLEALSFQGHIPSLFEYQIEFERRRFCGRIV
ncbi:hypothetical protein KR074_000646, partial [Drosophila pseudoananassae]